MDDRRFDQLTRCLDATRTRRFTLGGGLVALTSLALAMGNGEVEAKKKHKKKRKKKTPPPTCAELCGLDCSYCFFRADAPPLCGSGYSNSCGEYCASDNDCIGEVYPYCIARREHRATGNTTTFCGTDGQCDCGVGGLGICGGVFPCMP